MIKCNVAVTGLNAGDDPAPGIAVARSIRDSGRWEGKIIGLAYDALDTGIYSQSLLDEVYLLPAPFDRSRVLQRLGDITRKTRIDVLIPLLDLELLNLPSLEPSLKEMGINLLVPPISKVKMHLKVNLAEFCQEKNIKHPKQTAIASPDRIAPSIKELGIPVVIKGIIHGAHLAYSIEEALGYFNEIKKRWGLPIIVQECIHGEEYNVDCLADRRGRLIGAVPMRKLVITDKGKAWSGVTIEDEKLLNLSRDILGKLNWVGPIELEFIKQRPSGDYYLMEINPRFGTWIYLAANAGQNLPLATIQLAMGEEVRPFPPYRTGLIFTRCSLDSICSIERLANLVTEGELVLTEDKSKKVAHYA
jgi:carbamoyl-phosphate synthase large subunit